MVSRVTKSTCSVPSLLPCVGYEGKQTSSDRGRLDDSAESLARLAVSLCAHESLALCQLPFEPAPCTAS